MEPAAGPLLLLCLSFFFSVLSSSSGDGTTTSVEVNGVIGVDNPVITLIPSFSGSKVACERVHVAGVTRLKLGSYFNAYKVSLVPSVTIPEKYHNRIQICFHRNSSLGLCQCDEWKTVDKGLWSSFMSPYDHKYLDLKFDGDIYGSVTATVDEEFQRWRLFCLAFGIVLLLAAPIVSSWVPFYYSSSMAIGVLLVILILLFQAMKLLPTGRKSALYLTLYGSAIGAGSFLLHQFSSLVNSVLMNFGMTEEMHNPVSVFLFVGILLAGAALGYWIVRKFVISEDGTVDGGVVQFVKWAMRILAATFILQSTMDTLLAAEAFVLCYALCHIITSFPWNKPETSYGYQEYSSGYGNLWNLNRDGATYPKQKRTEFLSRSANLSSKWTTPKKSGGRFETPIKAITDSRSPYSSGGGRKGVDLQRSYFSTFHKTPDRKKFTKKEWEEFTRESTQQAVNELTASPAFTDWVIKNADRIKLEREDTSESTAGSESGSTEENVVEREMNDRFSLFNWR
ncbi:uncharacterized protein LOC124911283 isoform X2 [Impatiens glandulifera]|uniref:uncharacterized protein LOC124911283 isoform X2 n=1 Tax=Impatiens glandulifera TaxID=253017 RepID=UPI001FB0EA53|nr:uncharacterized protein LOC124911283 isoform X2 [Impatiens glandulifera]